MYLNLGQGVAWTEYFGRGSACAGRLDMYPEYEKGADIVSFDIYPVNETDAAVKGNLWLVPEGVDRLRQGSGYIKPVWNWIETTGIDDPANTPLAGAGAGRGVDVARPRVGGHRLLRPHLQPELRRGGAARQPDDEGRGAGDQRRGDLAGAGAQHPVIGNAATVTSQDPAVPVDMMVKRRAARCTSSRWRCARGDAGHVHAPRDAGSGVATVLGESRTVTVTGGSFEDDFSDYAVHLYRIPF